VGRSWDALSLGEAAGEMLWGTQGLPLSVRSCQGRTWLLVGMHAALLWGLCWRLVLAEAAVRLGTCCMGGCSLAVEGGAGLGVF
jgi:hypothetical protein